MQSKAFYKTAKKTNACCRMQCYEMNGNQDDLTGLNIL